MASIVKPASISWTEVFKRALKEANQDDVLGCSAQLSYYFFLAVFPFLICMIALLDVFSNTGEHIRQGLLHFLAGVLPGSAAQLIQKTLEEVSQSHVGPKMSVGIILSLWSASAGMSAIIDTLNAEYEVDESRSFVQRNAISIGLT